MTNPTLRFKSADGLDFPDTVSCTLADISKYAKGTIERKTCLFIGNEQLISNFGGATLEFRTEAKGIEFSNGDILFGNIRPYLKKVWLSDQSGVASPDVLTFKATNSIPGYLKCILSSERFFNHVAQGYKGSKMPRGDKHQIMDFRIQCPCLEEQQKIASFFSTLDQKIELNERKLEALEKLKKWVMQRIFNQNIRFFSKDGTTYPNWKIVKLSDVADTFNGDRGKNYPSSQDYVPTGIPFINAGDLINGSVSESCARITIAKYNSLSGAKLQKGDILYCLRGTLGKNGVCPFDAGTLASSLMAIRAKDCINPAYLYYFLNSHLEREQRLLNDEGAAQPNLSQKNVRNFQIPLPCIEEQQKIADLLSILGRRIEIERKRAEAMRKLKQGFMQQMFI